jgi:hypothetical protein
MFDSKMTVKYELSNKFAPSSPTIAKVLVLQKLGVFLF